MSTTLPTTPAGTKVGTAVLTVVGQNQEIGAVYFSNVGGNYGLTLWMIAGNGSVGFHGSGLYNYGSASIVYTFDAMLPMN